MAVDLAKMLRTATRTIRLRGVGASIGLVVEEIVGTARHGRSSGGRATRRELGHGPEQHMLQTARFRTARRGLGVVPLAERRGLVDLGCGRGRVLIVASSMGYSPVIGVELAPSLVADARAAVDAKATVIEGDAGAYALPADVTTVFMQNPFGAATVAEVVKGFDHSQRDHPRPLWIVYLNPVHRELFEAAGFEPVWDDPESVVLRRASLT